MFRCYITLLSCTENIPSLAKIPRKNPVKYRYPRNNTENIRPLTKIPKRFGKTENFTENCAPEQNNRIISVYLPRYCVSQRLFAEVPCLTTSICRGTVSHNVYLPPRKGKSTQIVSHQLCTPTTLCKT